MATVKASIGTNKYKTIVEGETKTFLVDEPADLGGTNLGPTPKELLAAALASCITITVRMYADMKNFALDDVIVNVTVDIDSKPGTTLFKKQIELVGDLDEKTRNRILTVAEKCPVNKILQQPIEIIKE